MCGIAGFFDIPPNRTAPGLRQVVTKMTDRLVSRGPDAEGCWIDSNVGIALGHRRLAVIDLSAEGHQPMTSACGQYIIVFNGEIYNHKALALDLEKEGFFPRGHSDTEVLLEAISHWGMAQALQRLNGMFAFALWDRSSRKLTLARDRFGEKPLFYGWSNQSFLFASELKSLVSYPGFRKEVNRNALTLYLRHNYIPSPYSIFKGIHKLMPGSYLTLSPEAGQVQGSPIVYWSIRTVAQSGVDHPFRGSENDAIEELTFRLKDAVRMRLSADVPLGAFLSGGIDSSTVVSLMQAESASAVKTFTIGFSEDAYNEAEEAKKIAQYLGTDHTELYVSAEETMAIIPRLPQIYDEPFADASQIPTCLLAQLARQALTVSLSGDGADEFFAGYSRYFTAQKILKCLRWIPRKGRAFSAHFLAEIAELPIPFSRESRRMSDILSVQGLECMYREMISHVNQPEMMVLAGHEPKTLFDRPDQWLRSDSDIQRMMCIDTVTYLPDDILVKVDRASMSVGLESRMPFLDHRLVELLWSFPLEMNVKNGKGKWLLRQVLSRYLPEKLFNRPKMGFGLPLAEWLRGPLREWSESLLNEKRLKCDGWFDPTLIRKRWGEHLCNKRDWHYFLWTILMFQAWLDEWG